MNITIRKAVLGEEKNVAEVNTRTWKTAYKGIVDDSFLENLDEKQPERIDKMRRAIVGGNVFVAVCAGSIVGMAMFGAARDDGFEGYGELYALYVLDAYQKTGVGKRLVNAVRDALRAKGYERFIIACFADNPSCGFYEKMGGRLIKRTLCSIGGGEYRTNIYAYGA